jgi:hypothetical protein
MSKYKEQKEEKSGLKHDTIVITGFARLPKNDLGKNMPNHIAVEFEINPVNSKVVDVDCTLLSFRQKQILSRLCLGNKIEAGIQKAIRQFDKRLFGITKPAVIAALKDAQKWYKEYQAENS